MTVLSCHSLIWGVGFLCVWLGWLLYSYDRLTRCPCVAVAPEVSVTGYERNWFVGQGDVKLDCGATANPPARHFSWTR